MTPSFRHHQRTKTGPDALLPLLPEVSTFTWSAVRSQRSSAESVGAEDMDVADVYSFPTNNATTSHLNLQDGLTHGNTDRYSVLGGPGGSAATCGSANVSPSGNRSLSPPGLYSKASSPRASDECVERFNTVHTNPVPRVPLSLSASSDATPSKANFYWPGALMEPLWEQSAVNAGSRPASLQLPSPPASPPVPPPSRSSSHVRSTSHVSSHPHTRPQSQSQTQPADWRFNRTRPPSSSAANVQSRAALPFRPTSSTATQPAWSPPVATNLNLPHSPPRSPPASHTQASPLTHAFRTSLQRSMSDATTTTADSGRYPSIAASTPPPIPETEAWAPSSRRRSGSVMSERPARPQGARPKPVEMLRQESSGSDVRAGRRSSMSAVPSQSGLSTLAADSRSGEHRSRAYLRSSVSVATPQVEESSTPTAQRAAMSYFEAQQDSAQPAPSSSHATSRKAASRAESARSPEAAELAAYSLAPSRRSSVSQTLAPTSVPSALSREGSVYEGRSARRGSSYVPRPGLPTFEPLPPMEFAKFDDDDD
ncbi:hypothetical protein EIP86_003790 [Pleurotus ostreatoroseus]|nr:hypothetical protein EIP86_003790 [Pleurotus ostreatoroseus]